MPTEEQIKEITTKGKQYKPAPLPDDMPRGPVGKCYDFCVLIACRSEYRYVEGIARHPKIPGIWILHAWLTDGIHAFDPTWKAVTPAGTEIPVPTNYIGIEMKIEDVGNFMLETEYAGVFANRWRNVELADKAINNQWLKKNHSQPIS